MNDIDRLFDSLFRNSVGFEFLRPYVDRTAATFPRYDVIKESENRYTINFALAGYKPDEVNVEWQPGKLTVSRLSAPEVQKKEFEESLESTQRYYYHTGLAKRDFKLTFALPDHIEVENAAFDNGLLQIALVRIVPEALQPKRIPIQVAGALEYQPEETKKVKKLEGVKKTA